MIGMNLRKLISKIEVKVSPLLGKIFYPPSGSNLICYASEDRDEIIVLENEAEYHLPGGIIESGEHPREAAKREFREETGLEAEVGELIEIRAEWKGIEATHFFYEGVLEYDFSPFESWEGKSVKVDVEGLEDDIRELIGDP
jgi:8-oxo-dGTP pyrophosphatase MutT (NUDIX family)